ncbi:hypothetical protein IQ07DRAFT_642173 [Pyrenochaeta sp. DS3sAY3a]|nr:hypothetical protein IQ07DRAFT_642173 [Pyrenochaeta sp. DS3sAY3a]
MNDLVAFCFLLAWRIVGSVYTVFSFALSAFQALGRPHPLENDLNDINTIIEEIQADVVGAQVVLREVTASMKEVAASVQSCPETLGALRELRTDFQALAKEVRETCEAGPRSMTDALAPAMPVLLEILAELRKKPEAEVDSRVQRRLRPFSFQNFIETQAKVPARETRAPGSTPELD